MKVYDIISEAEWEFGKGSSDGVGSTGAALGGAAAGALAARALSGAGTASKAGAVAQAAGKKASSFQKLKGFVETRKDKLAATERWWKAKAGNKLTLLFWGLGLVVPITQLYAVLAEIKRAKDADEISEEEYKELREFHFGVFQTQVLIPIIGKAVVSTAKIILFVRWIKLAGSLISAKFTAGASIAAHIASEAFIIWFQQWLGSDDGRKWLSDNLFYTIKYLGMPSESMWTSLMSYYEKSKKES
jgi:hypothetical protein